MNINNTWQNDNHGLHREYSGDISINHVIEATLELIKSPLFPSLQYLIEDYSNATSPAFNFEELESFSRFIQVGANTKSDLKVAIVSRNSIESITVANTFCEQMKTCHYKCQVFLSLASAQAWVTITKGAVLGNL